MADDVRQAEEAATSTEFKPETLSSNDESGYQNEEAESWPVSATQQHPELYTTPKLEDVARFGGPDAPLDSSEHAEYGFDLATPTLATARRDRLALRLGERDNLDTPKDNNGQQSIDTTPNLRIRTVSARSLQLDELAKLHDPMPLSSLTLGDEDGTHLTHLSLSTPTVESFSAGILAEPWRDVGNTPTGQRRSRSALGFRTHERTTSSASSEGSFPSTFRKDTIKPQRHSAYFPSTERPPEFQDYFGDSTPQTTEPDSLANHVSSGSRQFRSQSVSSSTSSIAESAGTAAEATDSEYEQERIKSIAPSREQSRRPSLIGASHSDPSVPNLKRLSSFAPIPALNLDSNSQKSTTSTPTVSQITSPNGEVPPQPTEVRGQVEGKGKQPTIAVTNGDNESSMNSVSAPDMEPNFSQQSSTSSHSNASSSSHPSDGGSSEPDHTGEAASMPSSRSSSMTGSSARVTHLYAPPMSSILSSPGSGVGVTVPPLPRSKRSKKSGKNSKSALQKAISKTRQKDLPPKPEDEDTKHLKEFQTMLAASKMSEAKKRQLREQQRAAKETLSNSHFATWDKTILPNWKQVLRDDKLKAVWWSGTMPPRYRSRLWQSCIGNGLALGKASYAKALALAQALRSAGKYPEDVYAAIEADIAQTLSPTRLFQSSCPLHDDLVNLLLANSTFWQSSKPTYSKGTSYLAAMLLISMPPQEAFLSLVNLINKSLLKTFYRGPKEDIEAYYRVFSTLLADKMPKIYRNFVSHDIRPHLYLTPWLESLYAQHLGFETATRIWDVYVLEGDQFLYRLALAVLQILEARLFNPDHVELAELFKGQDRGAKAIVARDAMKSEDLVEPFEVYELLGATEDAIFGTIKNMEWKEATFHRLLTRELPDADA